MIWSVLLTQRSMLHDLFTIGINGKTSGGFNTFASNCIWLADLFVLPGNTCFVSVLILTLSTHNLLSPRLLYFMLTWNSLIAEVFHCWMFLWSLYMWNNLQIHWIFCTLKQKFGSMHLCIFHDCCYAFCDCMKLLKYCVAHVLCLVFVSYACLSNDVMKLKCWNFIINFRML